MNYKNLCFCLLLLAIVPAVGLAQTRKISGTVYLPKKEPSNGGKGGMQSAFETREGVVVRIKEKDEDDFIAFTATNADGSYELTIPAPASPPAEYVIYTKYYGFTATMPVTVGADDVKEVNIELRRPGIVELSRFIVGFEQSGASSADPDQNFFMDLHIELPFKRKRDKDSDLGPRFRTWTNLRISSVPQQIQSSVSDFVVKFPEQFGNVKVNEVAQAAEFLAGIEFRFYPLDSVFASATGNHDIPSLNLIIGGGAITPITPKDTLQVFAVSDEARERLQIPAGKDFVAFVSQDRDRFFRQFYAGLRVKTRYFKDGIDTGRYDAMFDITYGVNESVTGGRLSGGVLRLEGFYALPIKGRFVSLFGTALMKPVRSNASDPLILDSPAMPVTVPGPNVQIITIKPINRDYYRIGAGIDLSAVIDFWTKKD